MAEWDTAYRGFNFDRLRKGRLAGVQDEEQEEQEAQEARLGREVVGEQLAGGRVGLWSAARPLLSSRAAFCYSKGANM
jgi:hypothetical protein